MPVTGLSNQWKSLDGLLYRFADGPDGEWRRKIRQLFLALDARPGPTIYVGTSLGTMNFSNRDVVKDNDRTCPFAYINVEPVRRDADELVYHTKTRKIEGARPTTEWVKQHFSDVEPVVDLLLEAFHNADVPSRRPAAR